MDSSNKPKPTGKAQRANDLNLAAQIQCGKIPDLQRNSPDRKALHDITQGKRLLSQEVTEEDIAQVVSVDGHSRYSNARRRTPKTCAHGRALAGSRGRPGEAITAVANAVRRARSGLQDPNRARFRHFRPTGVGKTELARALAEFCSMMRPPWSGST